MNNLNNKNVIKTSVVNQIPQQSSCVTNTTERIRKAFLLHTHIVFTRL